MKKTKNHYFCKFFNKNPNCLTIKFLYNEKGYSH